MSGSNVKRSRISWNLGVRRWQREKKYEFRRVWREGYDGDLLIKGFEVKEGQKPGGRKVGC